MERVKGAERNCIGRFRPHQIVIVFKIPGESMIGAPDGQNAGRLFGDRSDDDIQANHDLGIHSGPPR
jgi:hypothetical protein